MKILRYIVHKCPTLPVRLGILCVGSIVVLLLFKVLLPVALSISSLSLSTMIGVPTIILGLSISAITVIMVLLPAGPDLAIQLLDYMRGIWEDYNKFEG